MNSSKPTVAEQRTYNGGILIVNDPDCTGEIVEFEPIRTRIFGEMDKNEVGLVVFHVVLPISDYDAFASWDSAHIIEMRLRTNREESDDKLGADYGMNDLFTDYRFQPTADFIVSANLGNTLLVMVAENKAVLRKDVSDGGGFLGFLE